jgi:hypothetical protein
MGKEKRSQRVSSENLSCLEMDGAKGIIEK